MGTAEAEEQATKGYERELRGAGGGRRRGAWAGGRASQGGGRASQGGGRATLLLSCLRLGCLVKAWTIFPP